jgi:hypothetical protein
LSDLRTPPQGTVSYPDFALSYGEKDSDPCQVIDVPVSLFNAIVPSSADLNWLAHVRTVSLANKAGEQQASTADYSVVVGNRLPTPNALSTVHLVSLEGMGAYLPTGDTYTPADIPGSYIRLVSLQNWSFTSVDPKETFEGYLEDLDVGPLQIKATVAPTTDVERAVMNALNMGYTAIAHQTRQGDQTVSWYRGPFVPFAVPDAITVPVPDSTGSVQPITTADQAVRYNPISGMMDVSYAAAWQLGRLLALQNQAFSLALYNWKRATQQATVLAVEQAIIQEKLSDILPALSRALESPAGAQAYPRPADFLRARDLVQGAMAFLAAGLKPLLAPRKPENPEPRP